MEGIALRHWPKALGAVLGLLFLLSLLSFHLQDPTLTNLRLPSGGVRNWLGLPGALLGGSLLELLGTAALAAPALWLNWVLCVRERPALHRYAFWSGCLLLALAGLHGLAGTHGAPGLLAPGLAGWAVQRWCALTTGPWLGAALLAYLGLFAADRVAYAPAARTAAREARLIARWLVRESWRRGTAGAVEMRRRAALLRRVSGATALGLGRRTGLGLLGLVRLALLPPRALATWLAEWRAPSLAGIKARSARPGAAFGPRRGAAADALPGTLEPGGARDSFDDWLRTPEPDAVPAPAPADTRAATEAAPLAGRAPASAAGERAPLQAALPPWRRRPPVLDEALEPAAAMATPPGADPVTEPPPGAERATPAGEPLGSTDYAFEQPVAEAAWRQRFQRYARNLDLDWEEQLGARTEAGSAKPGHSAPGDGLDEEGADDERGGAGREP